VLWLNVTSILSNFALSTVIGVLVSVIALFLLYTTVIYGSVTLPSSPFTACKLPVTVYSSAFSAACDPLFIVPITVIISFNEFNGVLV